MRPRRSLGTKNAVVVLLLSTQIAFSFKYMLADTNAASVADPRPGVPIDGDVPRFSVYDIEAVLSAPDATPSLLSE
jgi:hypothetical protein